MPTVIQRLPATIALAFGFFVIFMWQLAISNSPAVAAKGLFYYIICGVIASGLSAYLIVIAAIYIAQLARE
jgi:hypothetical protein